MKRYFIVKNEELIRLTKEYESMRKKVNDAFTEFAKDNGIETKEYYQFVDKLMIVPTEKDYTTFKDMLKADGITFRKNSSVSKKWVVLCKEKELQKPDKPVWELQNLIGWNIWRFRSNLFQLDDKVYGTFETDEDFSLPDEHFIELKGSEFYKIIEDLEGK